MNWKKNIALTSVCAVVGQQCPCMVHMYECLCGYIYAVCPQLKFVNNKKNIIIFQRFVKLQKLLEINKQTGPIYLYSISENVFLMVLLFASSFSCFSFSTLLTQTYTHKQTHSVYNNFRNKSTCFVVETDYLKLYALSVMVVQSTFH